MVNNNSTIEDLIKGGVIGALLGALLSKDKEEGAMIGAMLGAAVNATLKANKAAKETGLPVLVEENGKLYAVDATGKKVFLKEIEMPNKVLPQEFILD